MNDDRAAAAYAQFPGVPKFQDFRRMPAEQGARIDAVVVATPDHTHAVIAAAAMRAGKHVYCEKPLTHDVVESRVLREIARQQGVVTQMGNVEMSETERVGFPAWASARYEISARGHLRPMELHHHHGAPAGRRQIEAHLGRQLDWGDAGERKWKEHGGCLIVGTEGMLKSTEHNSSFTLLPESKFAGLAGPPQTLPRSGSHEREFTAACKGGPPTMSNFDYAAPLVEFLLLVNVATQVGQMLEYDPLAGQITNHPEANALLRREYRQGWIL